jgi:hypothetical protein
MRRVPIVLTALALTPGLFSLSALASFQSQAVAAPAPAPAGSNLHLSTVGVPIISGGRLVNYILVRLSLTLRPGTDVSRMSEKEPYFREALVRLGYHTHLNPANSMNKVDPALVSAKMLPLCQAIAGPGVVTGVDIKYQEPEHWIDAPTPAQAAAPAPRPSL